VQKLRRRFGWYVMNNEWEQIKQYLEARMTSEAYRNWIQKTEFAARDHHILRVQVPDDITKQWLEHEYAEQIRAAIRDLDLSVRTLRYEIGAIPVRTNGHGSESTITFAPPDSQLNPRLSFGSFVVGSSNQFAHAAAQSVANAPSKSYNPLFIYGGVGVGKTHLMHAIGHSLLQNYATMRIVYTPGERFMNEMINCIKSDRMALFQRHYRSADVLLVDDIQILGGKERTQEEFFHTFNELYDHQKQIVISSDSSPKNTPGLVERLRSRFEWGLMVDIQPPDLETKMAILDKKAEAEGVDLPDDVRIFIARNTKSNVRELEGALVKLVAYSSVTGHRIGINMAQQVLKHLGQGSDRRVHLDTILRKVSDHYGLQPSQLKLKTNERKIAFPRQIAMYIVKELMQASLPEIGRMFGGKHHTTVLHSIQKIEELRHKDPELNRVLHNLMDAIH
jgi:chromosomal replication initiator protein